MYKILEKLYDADRALRIRRNEIYKNLKRVNKCVCKTSDVFSNYICYEGIFETGYITTLYLTNELNIVKEQIRQIRKMKDHYRNILYK